MNWYFTEFGGGIMISDTPEFGSLFIAADQIEHAEYDFDNLKFVSRA